MPLVRPEEIAASYHALYPEMKQHEVGLETLRELYRAVVHAGGHQPVVIDSDDLIASPAAVMTGYCQAVGFALSAGCPDLDTGGSAGMATDVALAPNHRVEFRIRTRHSPV